MNLTTICEEENSNSNRTVFDRQILEVNAEPTTSNNHGPLNDNVCGSFFFFLSFIKFTFLFTYSMLQVERNREPSHQLLLLKYHKK